MTPIGPDQQGQLRSKPLTAPFSRPTAPRKQLASWIEGSPALIAAFDAGVTKFRLERAYWREHKVGWRRVRLVYELRGPAAQVDAFAVPAETWAKQITGQA